MSVPCERCEEREATVECVECGRVFKSGNSETVVTSTTALLCNQCLAVLHESLGKFASTHAPIPLALKKLKETADQELQSLERAIADDCQQHQIEQCIQDTKSSCEKLDCEIQQMVSELREILDSREADLRSYVKQRRDQKLQLLEKQKEDHSKTVEEANQLTEELRHTLRHSLEELVSLQDTLEEQLEKVKCCSTSLLHHPPSPLIRGGTSCGFLVDTSLVKQALSCLLLCHEEEVSIGDRLSVAAVGGLSPQGTFWVHKVSDNQSEQVAMLQNISASIANELSTPLLPPLPSPHPGQLCCALYSQDQYWYRAMIESIPKPGRAVVYFMDYGGREEVPISTLAPLPEQFQLFPFQMLHCCFSDQSTLSFSRDARWNFSDTTRNGHLSVTILKTLPDNPHVPLHVVKLESVTSGEPFDIGATVVAIAEASSAPQKHHSIKYRDIRYKHIPPNPILTSSTEQSEPSNSVPTEPCKPSNSVQTEMSKPSSSVLPEPSGHPNATSSSATEPDGPPNPVPTEPDGPPNPVPTEPDGPPNPDPCEPPTEPSELQPAEGGGVGKKQHVPAEGVSVEEDVTGAVESLPSDQPQPLLKSSIAVPATADDRFEDATMDHEASVEEHAGGSVQTVSCHEVAGVDSTPAEDTTDQLSASHLDFGEESSYPKGAPQTAASSNVSQERGGEKEAHPRTATVGGVPGELRGEEGVCSSSAEQERTGTKPEIDRKLRLDLPQDTSLESGSAVIGENLADVSAEEPLLSLPSFVTAGTEVEAYVTTGLSSDGGFWAQVEGSREHTAMLKRLQEVVGETKGLYTPVFFSPGDLCAAQFSEDNFWYRARVESIQGEMFTVRYMDFGNVEERESGHLMSLKSDFRLLPFQAIQCSITTDDHPHFTQMEIEKFDEVVPFQGPVNLKVLRIVERMVFVQILLRLEGREPLDLTEEVYTADVSMIQSMDFSLTKKRRNVSSTSFDMVDLLPQGEQGMDWGERMDALLSPQDDCFLTLAGMENERSRSLTPTPLPPSHSTESEVERVKKPLLKDPPVLMHEGRGGREGVENWEETSGPNRSCVSHSPATLHTTTSRTSRLDVNMAHKQILANLDRKERRRVGGMERGGERREDREGELGAEKRERGRGRGERRGERAREGVERPPHTHLDYGQQLVSGLIGEQWDTPETSEVTLPTQREPVPEWNHVPQPQRSTGSPTPSFATTDFAKRAFSTNQAGFFVSQRPTASPTPNWRTPWTKYTKVFVKNMPRNRTEENVRTMFSKYGSVFEIHEHPSRTEVTYVYMDPGGAERAINALNKKIIKGRMLVVEVSTAPSPKRYN